LHSASTCVLGATQTSQTGKENSRLLYDIANVPLGCRTGLSFGKSACQRSFCQISGL